MRKFNLIKEQEKLRIFKVSSIERIKKIKAKYRLPLEVRIKKIAERDGKIFFLVDGFRIRYFIDIDFTMGGHGLRYVYIPLNEIWIDSSNEKEKEQIIKHELVEFNLMRKGMNYDRAHELASLSELEISDRKVILPVGHHRQITEWSCGPSALKIVLDYYEDRRDIKELVRETGCDKEGTFHKGFKRVLRKYSYRYLEKENAEISDIENFIQKAVPVIVDYQAYHGGHFSVVVGYDSYRFLISDPAYDKGYKWMNKKEFEKRWYEEDEPGKIVKRWMLAICRK